MSSPCTLSACSQCLHCSHAIVRAVLAVGCRGGADTTDASTPTPGGNNVNTTTASRKPDEHAAAIEKVLRHIVDHQRRTLGPTHTKRGAKH